MSAIADAQREATAKYVKVLGMARASRQDKLDLMRVLVQSEADLSLKRFLEDFLVDDKCSLHELKGFLEGDD